MGAGVTDGIARPLLVGFPVPFGLRREERVEVGSFGMAGGSSGEYAAVPAERRVTPTARGLLPLGGTVSIPATLPLRCSFESEAEIALLGTALITPATLPLRCSINAFCRCFTVSIDRTCSMAAGSSLPIVKPMTAGDIGVDSTDGALTSVLRGCGPPLTVTRRFLDGGPSSTGGGASEISTDGLGCINLDGAGDGAGGGVASSIS